MFVKACGVGMLMRAEPDGVLARVGPVMVVLFAVLVIWYVAAIALNGPFERDQNARNDVTNPTGISWLSAVLNQQRPVLPAPHQVVQELYKTTVQKKITSKRSLIHHSIITLKTTLLGFALGTVLGILLAVAILHNRALERALMPWIIASQTVPILAIAPMIIVVLNAVGIQGLLPKAFISTYLAFFPIVVGMVKGLRAADPLLFDLMRTYNASDWQLFWKLRLPASIPYLTTSMKVAVAIALVGAIVAELPTGAVAGLGARLLAGSYYGQTVQIWSALVMASLLAACLVALLGLLDAWARRRMGQVA